MRETTILPQSSSHSSTMTRALLSSQIGSSIDRTGTWFETILRAEVSVTPSTKRNLAGSKRGEMSPSTLRLTQTKNRRTIDQRRLNLNREQLKVRNNRRKRTIFTVLKIHARFLHVFKTREEIERNGNARVYHRSACRGILFLPLPSRVICRQRRRHKRNTDKLVCKYSPGCVRNAFTSAIHPILTRVLLLDPGG